MASLNTITASPDKLTEVRTHAEDTISPVRLLPIEGAYNIRDLGGYPAANNKHVKWRKVFRSGDLNKLTDADLEYLAAIPIKTYIDFRDSAEINAAPDRKPISLKNEFLLSIETGNIIDFKKVANGLASTLLAEGNKSMVRNNQEQYRRFFQILMNENESPLLFHCSAGKDRTGLGAALFLAALGVDRKTIIEDYLLSAVYLEDKYAAEIKANPVLAPLMTVKPEYIQAAFDVIDQEYGGMENYLVKNLGVDLNKMKALYTE